MCQPSKSLGFKKGIGNAQDNFSRMVITLMKCILSLQPMPELLLSLDPGILIGPDTR